MVTMSMPWLKHRAAVAPSWSLIPNSVRSHSRSRCSRGFVQSSKGKKERNDRVFVVPDPSPFEGDLQDIRRLPSRAIEELEKFFEATDALESKKLQFLGWRGPARAIKTIKKSLRDRKEGLCVPL